MDFLLFYLYMTTCALYSQPFLTNYGYNGCYRNIITINLLPRGPLSKLVRRVQFKPLSEFQTFDGFCDQRKRCGLALQSLRGLGGGCCGGLMSVEELPDLYNFLLSNGYKIETSLTKMTNGSSIILNNGNNNAELICFFSYLG